MVDNAGCSRDAVVPCRAKQNALCGDVPLHDLKVSHTVLQREQNRVLSDKSQISARTMINLDSEEEGVATVSCAGGVVVTYTCPIAREHKTGSALTLDISGLLGGHSGSDINLERGNGNLIMARIIDRLMVAGEPAIVSFNGGTKDNAINRECKAVLVYADHAAAEAAAEIARGIIADVTAELEVFDPGFTCTVEIADNAEVEAMDEKSALALIRALRLAPNGVIRRNVATDGSVEVSSNIGVVATSDDQVKIMLSPRSSITSLQNEFKDRLQTLADVLGFDAKFEFEYPGWSYAEHSPVRDVFVESYRELFGSELRIESIHAGLECGLFAEALHGLDAIAVGPTLSDVHTPDESMELASAERFYELLIDVLKRMDRKEFFKLSQITTKLDLDPEEFLYWLGHREVYAGEEERACAAIMDAALLRLANEGRLDVAAALLSGDQKTFETFRCEAPELVHLPAATFAWYEKNYLDRDYPIRLIMRLNGVKFPE